jgi:hypothetical protein
MRVEIVDIDNSSAEQTDVTFATDYGIGKGLWIGSAPDLLKSYYVEFTIEDLIWGTNVFEVSSEDFVISRDKDLTSLQGKIETVDDDGICTLRIGDSILLLDIAGKLPLPGHYIRVTTARVLLFDTNI